MWYKLKKRYSSSLTCWAHLHHALVLCPTLIVFSGHVAFGILASLAIPLLFGAVSTDLILTVFLGETNFCPVVYHLLSPAMVHTFYASFAAPAHLHHAVKLRHAHADPSLFLLSWGAIQ